ncbi:hypothetical protein BD410DRAFT_498529 [Rickenella mellea]|uniref:Uncharacterized protein n=1 Tax=Rickenella mellea TaxID=50990 RepID=A0A4Y7PU12_9AGAM|nr:hypothetical protein BD410DRAFT_498529 [Rickenella mellea]
MFQTQIFFPTKLPCTHAMEFTLQFPPPIPTQNVPQNEQKRTPNPTPCLPCSHPSVKSKCEMSPPWSSTLCQRCCERGITCVPKPKTQRQPRASRKLNQQAAGVTPPHGENPIDHTMPATITTPVVASNPTLQNSWTTFHTSATRAHSGDIDAAEPSNSRHAFVAQARQTVSQNTHEQPALTPSMSQVASNAPYVHGIRREWVFDHRFASVHTGTIDACAPVPTFPSGNPPMSPRDTSGFDSV